MALGISSFDNISNNMPASTGAADAGSNEQVAGILSNIFGSMFSGGSSKIESSGTVACIFGDNVSLDSDGNGSGGEIIFGGFSGGGGSSGDGGGMSLA